MKSKKPGAQTPKGEIERYVALLRGINVGGHNLIAMPELRSECLKLGWARAETYIQSGNLVFAAAGATDGFEGELEKTIQKRFKCGVAVVVRSSDAWSELVQRNPFTEEAEKDPQRLMLALAKAAPAAEVVTKLQERAKAGEQIQKVDDALYIFFPEGVGRSKLTPDVMERAAGSPVTMRNWRTVLKLQEMLQEGLG